MKKILQFAGTFTAAVFFAGCSSYHTEAQDLRKHWATAQFEKADAVAESSLEDSSDNTRLLWQLERGATLRAVGKTAESVDVLEQANASALAWEDTPDVQLSREALAALTNLSAFPYRGRSSDLIMLHTYRALNFLETDKIAAARTALNAALQAQRDAVDRHAADIEKAQKEAKESNISVADISKKSGIREKLKQQNAALAEVRVLADYVNPFTTWLHGIFFLNTGTDNADIERARVSLKRVSSMYPENRYISEDLRLAEAGTQPTSPLTYVVFESGLAPIIGETRFDATLPIPYGRGYWVPTPISIALPKLVLSDQRRYWGLFPIVSGGGSQGDADPQRQPALSVNGVPAAEICDMNSIVRTDFDNAFAGILTRTIATAVLKAAASVALNSVATEYAKRDNSVGSAVVQLATIIGTTAYTYASSGADTRCWQTLPQNFSIARLATPASRKVVVRIAGRSREIDLLPGKINLVVVKTTTESGPPIISQSVLKK